MYYYDITKKLIILVYTTIVIDEMVQLPTKQGN